MKKKVLPIIIVLALTSLIPLSIESDPVSDVKINNVDSELIDSVEVYTKHGYDVSRIIDPFVYRSEVLTEGHLPLVLDIEAFKGFNLDRDGLSNLLSKNERHKQGFGEITYTYNLLVNETYSYEVPVYRDEPCQYNVTYWVNETGNETEDPICVCPWNFRYYNITWDDCYNVTTNGTRQVLDHYKTIEDYRYVWRETKKLEGLSFKTDSKIIVDIQGNFKAGLNSRQVDIVPVINIATYSRQLTEYAWWNSNWSYSKKITIDHNYIDTPLTDFPVLFDNMSSDYEKAQTDGDDFVFVDSTNATQFAHEIEWFNVSDDNRLIAWVNVTSISSISDTILYLYYGNATCGRQQNPTGVWDSSYKIVQHMDGADLAGTDDSTSNYNNATEQGGDPSYQQTGQIGYGVTLDGNDWVCFGDDSSIKPTTITVEAWFNTATVAAGARTIFQMPYTSGTGWNDPWVAYGFMLSAATPSCHINVGGAGGYKGLGAGSVVTGSWYYMAMTYDGEDHNQYLNTSLIASGSYSGSITYVTPFLATGIKNPNATGSQEFWNGMVDELRVSSGARNASWTNASFHAGNQTAGFLTWGTEQPKPPEAGVPVVTTNTATGVEETNATIRGTLTSNGTLDTTCYFLWGTQSPPTDNNVSQGVIAHGASFDNNTTGLTKGQLYFFDTKANNSEGWDNSGGVKVFLTKPDPATSISTSAITGGCNVSWTHGAVYNTSVLVYKTTGYPSSPTDGTEIYNGTNDYYEHTGLSKGTYYYRVWEQAKWTYNPTLYQYSDDNESTTYEYLGVFTLYATLGFGGKANVTGLDVNPVLSNPNPANGSTGQPLNPTLSITASDPQGDLENVTFRTNASGPWVDIGSNASSPLANGTYSQTPTNMDSENTKYYWSVNATDAQNHWTNETYYFTTGAVKPVLSNEQPTNGTTDADMYPTISITVSDLQGNNFNITWTTNATGTWIEYNATCVNGTYSQTAIWANQSNTTYWWNVSVNDTDGNWANATYHFKTDVYGWGNWSEWWTFDYFLGLPPVLSNPNPANGSTDVPVSTTIWNITIGDPEGNTFNWSIETAPGIGSNSSNGDTNGSKEVTIAGNLSYDTNYTVYVNATDIGSKTWTNETFWFETEADTVAITRISQIPSNIRINSTGDVFILFNITTNNTAINSSSILVVHTVNQTYGSYYLNASYRIPNSSKQPDMVRACNRNEDHWFEKFNISGTGEIGDIGEWGAHDIALCKCLTVEDSGSNWTRVNWTPNILHLFASIWYVDRTNMTQENKTGQYVPVYKNHYAKTEFNMSNTGFIDNHKYKNTTFQFYFYANHTENKDLTVYFANSSYTTGDPKNSPYCEPVGIIRKDTPYYQTVRNSSYYLLNFSSNETGYVGTVNMSETFYFIFTCDERKVEKATKLYYANDTIPDNTNFNETGFAETSDNKGASWAGIAATFDCHLQYAHLNPGLFDVIAYKFYAQDTSNNSAWSSEYHDALDIVNIPPTFPDVITPNGTVDYTVGDTINISYGWLGDPNHETCWLNTTLWNWNGTTLIGYLQNRSITDVDTHIYNVWSYDWDTAGQTADNYTVNVTATDPYGASNYDVSEVFNLTKPPPIFSNPNPANGSTDLSVSINTWNITIETLFGDTFNWTIETSPDIGSNSSNGDTNGSKEVNVSGNLSYTAHYAVFVNATDAGSGRWTNETFWFETEVKYVPSISNPYPSNGSVGVNLQETLSVYVSDPDGDLMNVYWYENTTSSFVLRQTNASVPNGTYYYVFTQANAYNTKYWWKVAVNDSIFNTTAIYHFTTRPTGYVSISDVIPANGAIAAEIVGNPPESTGHVSLSFTLNDSRGGSDMSFYLNVSVNGVWVNRLHQTNIGNGTWSQMEDTFNTTNTTYWWNVSYRDGTDPYTNNLYHFRSEARPDPPDTPSPANVSKVENGEVTLKCVVHHPDALAPSPPFINVTFYEWPSRRVIGYDNSSLLDGQTATCDTTFFAPYNGTWYYWYAMDRDDEFNSDNSSTWFFETYYNDTEPSDVWYSMGGDIYIEVGPEIEPNATWYSMGGDIWVEPLYVETEPSIVWYSMGGNITVYQAPTFSNPIPPDDAVDQWTSLILSIDVNTTTQKYKNFTARPDAAGSKAGLNRSGAAENWQCVDEVAPDDNATFVYTSSTNLYADDSYSLSNHTVAQHGDQLNVTVVFRCKNYNSSDTGEVEPTIKTHGSFYNGSTVALTDSWATYSYMWDLNPNTNQEWTWDEIDDLEAGISMVFGNCTQVYVNVSYRNEVPMLTTQFYTNATVDGRWKQIDSDIPEQRTNYTATMPFSGLQFSTDYWWYVRVLNTTIPIDHNSSIYHFTTMDPPSEPDTIWYSMGGDIWVEPLYVETEPSIVWYSMGGNISIYLMVGFANETPVDGTTGLWRNVILSAWASKGGEPVHYNFTFYTNDTHDGNWSEIGALVQQLTNLTVTMPFSDLEWNKTYWWKVIAVNDTLGVSTSSATWQFTTNYSIIEPVATWYSMGGKIQIGYNPNASNPYPANGSAFGTHVLGDFSVLVTDPDNNTLNVTFYNASDDSVFGIASNVPNNTRASVSAPIINMTNYTWFEWYVIVNDSVFSTTSDTWRYKPGNWGPTGNFTPWDGNIHVQVRRTISAGAYQYYVRLIWNITDVEGDEIEFNCFILDPSKGWSPGNFTSRWHITGYNGTYFHDETLFNDVEKSYSWQMDLKDIYNTTETHYMNFTTEFWFWPYFNWTPYRATNGDNVLFVDESANATSYWWYIDGVLVANASGLDSSDQFNMTYKFNISNVYNITQKIYNKTCRNIDSITRYIYIDRNLSLNRSKQGTIPVTYYGQGSKGDTNASSLCSLLGIPLPSNTWVHKYNSTEKKWHSFFAFWPYSLEDFNISLWDALVFAIGQNYSKRINITEHPDQRDSRFSGVKAKALNNMSNATQNLSLMGAHNYYICWSNVSSTKSFNLTDIGLAMNDWVFKYNTSTGAWDSAHYWPESPYPIGTNFTINAYDIFVLRLATDRWINIEGGFPQMVI